MDRFLPVISWYGRMRFAAVYAGSPARIPDRKLCQFTVKRRAWQFGTMAGRLAGKRALVTAAAQGIGRATPRTPNGWRGFGASTITRSIIGSLGPMRLLQRFGADMHVREREKILPANDTLPGAQHIGHSRRYSLVRAPRSRNGTPSAAN